jgi:4-hydroxybenzoate polyprenyltransferase
MVYDTLYAHQDKRDDARLGLRSTALTFGDRTKPILGGFAAAMLAGLTAAGVEAELAWPFFVGTGFTGCHLGWQLLTARLDDPANLARRFDSNKWVGALVFGSIVAGRFVA